MLENRHLCEEPKNYFPVSSCSISNKQNSESTRQNNITTHIKYKLHPSTIDLYQLCPGSLLFHETANHTLELDPFSIESLERIPSGFTSPKYSYCDRGRFVHTLIAANLMTFFSPPQDPYYETLLENLLTQNPTTREFVDSCSRYAREEFSKDTSQTVYIEAPLDCLKGYDIKCFYGRCDFALVSTTAAEIVDFKTGTEPVDPSTSLQLLCYAAAMKSLHPNITNFTLTILQSNTKTTYHTSSYYLTADELDIRIQNEVLPLVLRCEAGELPFTIGSHCSKCPYLYKCTAGLKYYLVPIFKEIEDQLSSSNVKLGSLEFVPFIHLKSALNATYDEWRGQIIHDMLSGKEIPNIQLRKSTKEVYTDEDAVVNTLKALGIDTSCTHQVKDPKNLRAALDKDTYANYVAPLVRRVPHSTSITYHS